MKFTPILFCAWVLLISSQLSALDVIGNLSGIPDATSARLQWTPFTGPIGFRISNQLVVAHQLPATTTYYRYES